MLQPLIAASNEPMLLGVLGALGVALLAVLGAVIRWFAVVVIEARDGMRSILQTLHGPKEASGMGLVGMVAAHHQQITGALGALSNENVLIDNRLTRLEERCGFNHASDTERAE
jgi:hypothetical protein